MVSLWHVPVRVTCAVRTSVLPAPPPQNDVSASRVMSSSGSDVMAVGALFSGRCYQHVGLCRPRPTLTTCLSVLFQVAPAVLTAFRIHLLPGTGRPAAECDTRLSVISSCLLALAKLCQKRNFFLPFGCFATQSKCLPTEQSPARGQACARVHIRAPTPLKTLRFKSLI